MQRSLLLIALLAGVLVVISQSVQSQSEQAKQGKSDTQDKEQKIAKTGGERAADESAIRANIAEFVRLYNNGNAKAIAALFTPEAVIVDKQDNTEEGRAAIEKTFAEIFSDSPQKNLEVFVDSIRFLGPDMAVEVGWTKEISAPGESPIYDRYTVLHVKRDGKWQMALARDSEGEPPTNHEQLLPLAWLVGEWIDDGGSVVVRSKCDWSDDGNYLLQEFDLEISGQKAMHVTQRIGWDPMAKRIRSWVFDSEGGYGESIWTRNGDAWIIRATGVRSDGTTASATNMLVRSGADGYVWRSTDRVIDDEVVPPVEVKVVRKAPQPK